MEISLVTVTDGAHLDNLKRMIESARPCISEVVIVYQGKDDDVYRQCAKIADFCIKLTSKGNADPDRNFAYGLATKGWILALDDDEWLPSETQEFINRIILSKADVVWFNFRNLVDGTDIKEILGDDPHPRLWRRMENLILWPQQAHTFPQINSPRQYFTGKQIVHDRKFEELEARHLKRMKMMDGQNVQLETNFITALKKILKKA